MSVNSKMTAIADAIRAKSGKTGLLTLDAMADEIGNLSAEEIIQHANIPDYVKEEALRVANAVQAVRKDDSIVFLAMSDNHQYGAQADAVQYPDATAIKSDTGNLHAAMAAKIFAYALGFDFMAQLGDATFGNAQTTSELLRAQTNELLSFLRESHKDIPCFHAIGNHDSGIGRQGLGETREVVVKNYFEPREWSAPLPQGETPVIWRHRPLSEYVKAFIAAGLTVEDMDEPRATAEEAAQYPSLTMIRRIPLFLYWWLRKERA
jgi:hypothetical protein